MTVVVIGASDNPERYSFKAINMLLESGYKVFPVNPSIKEILGLKVYKSVRDIKEKIDTITLYVNENVSSSIISDLLASNPHRIIFNPGAENKDLFDKAESKGVIALNACTLVLLQTKQF